MKLLRLLPLWRLLLKLGLGQLSSVQRVSIELAQSVEFEQTDRADRVLIDSYRISWSCHFVVRKDFRGSFPGST